MKVFWTPEASETFNSNIDYLLIEWGESVASDFLNRVDDVVESIRLNPKIYPLINKNNQIRRCVVVKQITLYYRVVSFEQIDLLTFWNNYQNPEFLKL
ncbi:MAG TPA: type II toxin-antitoxin system RelE/ParE family toxin [Ignavibacteriaceae bacterium]